MSIGRWVIVWALVAGLVIWVLPAVSGDVSLVNEQEQYAAPGEPVEFEFFVENTNRLTMIVEVMVQTAWDYEVNDNEFTLIFNQDKRVSVIFYPPADARIGDTETAIITFNQSSSTTKTEDIFTLKIYITDEDDYYDGGLLTTSDLGIENFARGYLDNLVFVIVGLLLILGAGAVVIRKKFLVREVDKNWAEDITPELKKMMRYGTAHPQMKKVWTARGLVAVMTTLFIVWISAVIIDLMFFSDIPLITITVVAFILPCIVYEVVWAHFYYQAYTYVITDDRIIVNKGIISRRRSAIPFKRIQNVDTVADFWQRLFKVKSVQIETAGSGGVEGVIQGLVTPEPVANYIVNKVRTTKSASGIL